MKAINKGIVLIRGGRFGSGILERFKDDLFDEVTVSEATPAHPQRQTPAGQSNDPTARPAGGHLTVIRGGRDE